MRTVSLLALGTFALGMDAFIVAGLIPQIAVDTGAAEATVGQMVTVFTLCYAISGPLLSSLLNMDTKTVLVSALLVFTLGNAASAVADSLLALLVSRSVSGFGAGLYSPMAAAAAAQLAAPGQRGRALSVILAGLSVGTVIGVPVGLLLAGSHGWRSAFWLVTAIGMIAALGVARCVPRLRVTRPPGIRARLAAALDRRVAPIVLVSLLFNIASLGLYTYIAPVLQTTASITNPTGYLWIWGVGGILGAVSIGVLIDRAPSATRVMPLVLAVFVVATAMITPAGGVTVLVGLALALWGAAGFASPPPQQHLLLERAPDLGAVALALNGSTIYLGAAIGSALGGIALHAGASAAALPPAASATAAIAGVAYVALVARHHRSGSL